MSHSDHNDTDEKAHDRSDDGAELDFSKIRKIFHSKIFYGVIIALLILIPVVLTIYIRLLPQDMPATDQWAQSSVYNYYKNGIAQQVNAQYPNLPAQQKQKLVDEQFAQFEKTNKESIDQQVKETSEYFKAGFQYQDNNQSHTFLGDLDSYFYLRYARNLEEKGNVCDEMRDGKCWDNHMLAPMGGGAGLTMHPLGTVYLYRIGKSFDKNFNLMDAAFILPTIIAIIATIAAFFVGRKLMNDVAGFFAAMFVSLSPLFISRTLGSDTDVWNVMFPLVIILVFLYAFESKVLWKKLSLTFLAGFIMGIFSFAWGSGWWYIFDFIIATIIMYIVFELIKGYINYRKKHVPKIITEEVKVSLMTLGTLIISTMIFVSVFVSFSMFRGVIEAPISMATGLKTATNIDIWPNVYTTVAELNEASVPTVVSQVSFGINVLFSLALLGVIFTLVKKKPEFKEYMLLAFSTIIYLFLISNKALNMGTYMYLAILILPIIMGLIMILRDKESDIDIKMALLLTIWFVGMIFAGVKGVRFILLLTPAFGIAIGVAIGYIFQYAVRAFHQELKLNEKIAKIIVFALLCLIVIAPIQSGIAVGKSYMPSMTKGWWDSLTQIRDQSEPDAIINSWWDFGHWFKYAADRAVTLDGASQNGPQAHWLGLMLQTDDERRTVGVLRMLDCGSNQAFEEIDKRYNDTEVSENIVSEIIMLDKDEAEGYLENLGYSSDEISRILEKTHCNPPENYMITSEDMVGKAGVWAHFGLWNFDRAYIIKNLRDKPLDKATQIMKDRWNYSEEEAKKIYYDIQALQTDRDMNDWISPWPGYATSSMISCVKSLDNIVYCDTSLGIGGNSQQNIVIERVAVNLSNPNNSNAILGIYDRNSGAKLGQNSAPWAKVVIADDKFKEYTPENSGLNLAVLINAQNENNSTRYSAVIADQLLISSTFTKLFYLDGKGTEHFEKFSDVTDITGTRIIVWKVKW